MKKWFLITGAVVIVLLPFFASAVLWSLPRLGAGGGDKELYSFRDTQAAMKRLQPWLDQARATSSTTHGGPEISMHASTREPEGAYRVREREGLRIETAEDGLASVLLAPGATAWSVLSDHEVKENVSPADGAGILNLLSQLEVSIWNLKSQGPETAHIGPMAQDFNSLFNVGEDPRYINSSDVDGISLIALQELHRRISRQRKEIESVREVNADLQSRIAELEKQILTE